MGALTAKGQGSSLPGSEIWQQFSGKTPPTDPKLPQGFGWLGNFAQGLAQGAPVDYGASTAAQNAGQAGANAAGATATGTLPGTAAAFGGGLAGLGNGLSTGFMPDVSSIDAMLRPGVERSFQTGSADIREQNALTGNLSSTGAGQQITDLSAQLNNNLNNATAGILGNAVPASIGAQSDLTKTALQLPGFNSQTIYNPATSGGLQGQQNVLGAIQTAMSAISGAPFFARQGSAGNGALGAGLGGLLAKG